MFGRENVYVELQRHQEREEEWRNQAAFELPASWAAGACDQWRALCDSIGSRDSGSLHVDSEPRRNWIMRGGCWR